MRRKINSTSVKIVFIGGRDKGLECLQALVKREEKISYIFCMREDKHETEKFSLKIKKFADKNHIPVILTNSVVSKEAQKILTEINPDLIIVMGWRTIIPPEILELPSLGCIAVHESLLPKYRGFAPINWATINGEKITGVTLFYLDSGIDSGDIIAQKKIPIKKIDTANNIYKEAKKISIELLLNNLDAIKKGFAKRKKQNEKDATYTCARIPEDGLISWEWPSEKIYNYIKALSRPYPGAFTFYQGKKVIIQKAYIPNISKKFIGRIPGRIVEIKNKGVSVLTKDGTLKIEEIELEKGKIVAPKDFFRSIKGTLGR